MNKKNIVITSGDQDGIGPEVAIKALNSLSKQAVSSHQFLLYIDADKNSTQSLVHNEIEIIHRNDNPTNWVYEACLQTDCHLVTGPLSKTTSYDSEHRVLGHTGLFRKLYPETEFFMLFLGDVFNVALLTDHIPLKQISINKDSLSKCIQSTYDFLKPNKPIGVLGLNPHAGEQGLLGNEESLISKTLDTFDFTEGPLVPDAAFMSQNRSRYSCFVAMYHDQGLIPFKMIHGQDDGVQVTLNLPFFRVSVDHGTAKDLYGKNCANEKSMLKAINWAIKMNLRGFNYDE